MTYEFDVFKSLSSKVVQPVKDALIGRYIALDALQHVSIAALGPQPARSHAAVEFRVFPTYLGTNRRLQAKSPALLSPKMFIFS